MLLLFSVVVTETNRYAEQQMGKNGAHSRGTKWKPSNVREIKTFFGLTILMGIIKKPSVSLYWSTDEVIATPFFSDKMSRNRFEDISSYLHFNNNEEVPPDNEDRLYKLRTVIDYLTEKFKTHYQLNEHISIDEGTLKWKGRLRFRVYNPMKPIKYGIKSYVLADSISGYCGNIRVYDGVSHSLHYTVFGLVEHILNRNHKLYCDNFYNSVRLSEELLAQGMHSTGTLRANRGEPKEIRNAGKNPKMKKGDVVALDNGKVVVVAWMDNRKVVTLSTQHDATTDVVRVRKRGGGHDEVQKPKTVIDYNQYMSGRILMTKIN